MLFIKAYSRIIRIVHRYEQVGFHLIAVLFTTFQGRRQREDGGGGGGGGGADGREALVPPNFCS